MIALSEAFATALQHHRAGDARQAEEICRNILKKEPHHAAAVHLLGVLTQQAGRNEEALAFLRRAVALCPGEAEYQYNLGVLLQVLGHKAEAQTCYRAALRLHPDHAGALNNLGNLALSSDQLEEAEDFLRHVLRIQPSHGPAYHNLGLVCKRRGNLDEAIACFRQAVRLCPDDAAIHFLLGQTLEERDQSVQAFEAFRQSVCHRNVPKYRRVPSDEAVAAFREAVRLGPDSALFRSALGNVLTSLRRLSEALPHCEQALRREPDAPGHHSNLGNILTQLGRPQEAEARCREAIRLKADFVGGHLNLANALAAQGRLDEALRSVEEVLRLEPENASARHCRALWLLQQGRFAEGWPDYEWRWKLPDLVVRQFREPLWDGSPLKGRTILLWTEQGFGDALLAIRFAPLVKQCGGTVVVECQAPLVRLLAHCAGIDQLVPRGSPLPAADVQAPLMSLPWLLGLTLESLPAVDVPYLFADPALVEQWRRELEGPPSLKIGIAWQGNPEHIGDRNRSIPLRQFAALAHIPGVRLISLQKGAGQEQLREVSGLFPVVDLGSRLDDFADTAAVMKNLDLVIACDTSVVHLAGALGVPVWVALPFSAEWRWLLDRDDSPWYPTMRLFRQTRFGDWDEVFARIAEELASGGLTPPVEREQGVNTPRSPADLAQLWSRALAHFQAAQREQAEQLCQEVLALEPCHAEALNLLGVLAHQAGQNELARQRLERAVVLRPKDAGFHYNLGVARHVLGHITEAAASYRQTLRFQPNHPTALNNLGRALFDLGQDVEARQYLEQAVHLQPDYAEAHINLGSAYLRQRELEKAEVNLKQALRLRPDHADSYSRLGIAVQRLGRLDEAIVHFHEPAQLSPNFATVHHNLAMALAGMGRYGEALASCEQALQLDPDSRGTRFVRAMIWLLLGDFENGWPEYEYRWRSPPIPQPDAPQPLWDGSPLDGKTILLWAEQGLGDTIQFIRYVSLVKQQGGTVVVQCPAPLTRLLSSCPGIDLLVQQNAPLPAYDVHAPLLSLPRIFGTTLETIPAKVPYLFANNDLVQRWQRELSSLSGFRVGIAWQGRPTHLWDLDRSIPLRHFAPLAHIPGVRLISLQKGASPTQLQEIAGLFSVTDLGSRLNDFADTAAVMKNLDLIIACDTSVVHLAGALGVPVWTALPFAPDWRWLSDREDSPWYATMRLFRQARRGDWDGVFQRIAAALCERVASKAPEVMVRPLLDSAVDHLQAGCTQEAQRCSREILAVVPNNPDALNLLAIIAHQADRPAEAADLLRRAIVERPADASLHYNLAVAQHVQGELDAAIASYEEALRLRPEHADTCNNLGFALAERNRLEEALSYYARAVRLKPAYAEAYANSGLALATLGKAEEALGHCEQALRIEPNNADAHLARAALWLLRGDYERGWVEYEWRWKPSAMASRGIGPGIPSQTPPPYSQPMWDGTSLVGRTILLHAEQGFGDTIQFIRYAPLVKERGGTVVVACQPSLIPLLRGCPSIDVLIAHGSALPRFDVWAPLLSLPRIFGTTLATIPAEVPYVWPDSALVESWKRELSAMKGCKVGIAWECNRRFDWGRRRRASLGHFAPLAGISGVQLFSLQKGPGQEQLREVVGLFPITDLGPRLDDFADTAAIMRNLDLVITVDTSVAHLAGALGVPVWVALSSAADWRWLLGRDDSPWYPSMRLFRQERRGDWQGVFSRMADELRRKIEMVLVSRDPKGSASAPRSPSGRG